MGWVLLPQNVKAEVLSSNVTSFRKRAMTDAIKMRSYLSSKGPAPIWLAPYWKFAHRYTQRRCAETQGGNGCLQAMKRSMEQILPCYLWRNQPRSHIDVGLLAPELWPNKCVSCKSPSLCTLLVYPKESDTKIHLELLKISNSTGMGAFLPLLSAPDDACWQRATRKRGFGCFCSNLLLQEGNSKSSQSLAYLWGLSHQLSWYSLSSFLPAISYVSCPRLVVIPGPSSALESDISCYIEHEMSKRRNCHFFF
jgi:hypothetical protein